MRPRVAGGGYAAVVAFAHARRQIFLDRETRKTGGNGGGKYHFRWNRKDVEGEVRKESESPLNYCTKAFPCERGNALMRRGGQVLH